MSDTLTMHEYFTLVSALRQRGFTREAAEAWLEAKADAMGRPQRGPRRRGPPQQRGGRFVSLRRFTVDDLAAVFQDISEASP